MCRFARVCVCVRVLEFVNESIFLRLCVKINQAIRGLSVCAPLCGTVATDCADRPIHNLSIFGGSAIQCEQDAELILMTGRVCRCCVFISSSKFLMLQKCPPCFASYCQLVCFFTASKHMCCMLQLTFLLLFSRFKVIFCTVI